MLTTAIAVNPQNPKQFIEIEHTVPEPGPRDLLIAVKAIALNPIDSKIHQRLQNTPPAQPAILGWDASGVVQAVGREVKQFKVGDAVWYSGDLHRSGCNARHQLVDYRLVAHKPNNLDWAEAAAMPLTALTAWEALYEKLQIQQATCKQKLLIIGAAGGVGSMALPLAALRSEVEIIATASREDSAQWCRKLGASLIVNHHNLSEDLHRAGIKRVEYILCLNNTDSHWSGMTELIAPFGHICCIVQNQHPLNQLPLKDKSASLHWESMYTRSLYQTDDMDRQGHILRQITQLTEQNKLHSTLNKTLEGLTVETIVQGHELIKEGHMRGKLVIVL
ncbi:MAG: zinc-binding alcohol dehydrogenase family protein [Enterobacteriaceae bacterium]